MCACASDSWPADFVKRTVASGACGYLMKDARPYELEQALRKLIAQGKGSKEIAFDLGLSPETVDLHRARIMERLHLGDIASLTRYAVRKGLVKP